MKWIANAAREIALQHMTPEERLRWMETDREPTEVLSSHARAMFYWVSARIEEHAEPLVALLRESRREHDEDGCGLYGRCNCGADAWNAKIDEALK